MITWDENKRKGNLKKHRIDFADLDVLFNHYMYRAPRKTTPALA
ncbi:hypothetical protein GTP81_18335 [Rugamonas sp. FT107W]|uniref:BrnT family toxin n=1 Tax=Duganella vulcania TaxID=2692166 RepID=A0A845HIX2_9BURK|nr:hypothetical protein [Duganella vulcania]